MSFERSRRSLSLRAGTVVAAVIPVCAALASPVAVSATTGVPAHAALQRIAYATSTNWSGYASTHGPFQSVSASWVQPKGTCTSKTTYAAFWIGLDGDGSNTVEQTGSEVDCSGGSPVYYAWYEMYPAFPVNYTNVVEPGDHFSASVTVSGTSFALTITDSTEGWSHTQNKTSSTAKKHSAEIIAEAPSSGSGVLPLTNFGTVQFLSALADGVAIGTLSPVRITMASGGHTKAKPSALSSGENFSVVWHHS